MSTAALDAHPHRAVETVRVEATLPAHRRLLSWAKRSTERRWAVENAVGWAVTSRSTPRATEVEVQLAEPARCPYAQRAQQLEFVGGRGVREAGQLAEGNLGLMRPQTLAR
jgi:hypothetical protein